MKILVINAGSSSLKYQLIDMETEQMIAKGNCERVGQEGSFIGHKTADGRSFEKEAVMENHAQAFMVVKDALLDKEFGVIETLDEVSAIGHRVVQGGSIFKSSVLIDEKVLADIDGLSPLAPLHNPAHVLAMKGCLEVFGNDTPMVAVFDTSFHSTMPEKAYMYAVPYEFYEKYAVRRYGAHGTSHRYVSAEMAKIMAWTQAGNKYFGSADTYVKLRKRGITKGVYKGTKGFVKSK